MIYVIIKMFSIILVCEKHYAKTPYGLDLGPERMEELSRSLIKD